MATTIFSCKRCGRAIFRSDQILGKVNLWDLGEYQPLCYKLSGALGVDGLRRYDCSLHEGWYCCRFILMRMVVDKFGTGSSLLVYADSVEEHPEGQPLRPAPRRPPAQVRLGERDFDAALAGAPPDALCVVKFGAIWCPPCRLMDSVIAKIHASGGLPGVHFFEVDIDEERELAARYPSGSVPTFMFFHGGKLVPVHGERRSPAGGSIGSMPSAPFVRLCQEMLARARAMSAGPANPRVAPAPAPL
jgi:thiol-disulfide isomerase/thioredoxin